MKSSRFNGRKSLWMLGVLVGSLAAGLAWKVVPEFAGAQERTSARTDRLFELRTYYCNEGKLPDLHKRFRNHTNYLFVKHGMSLIAYWTPEDEKDVLVYVLAYPNRESRDRSWKGFMDDPVWKKVFAESRENGALVKKVESRFMRSSDYSPVR